MTPSDFFTEHVLEHNQKTTATPTLTVIAAVEKHSLPLFASLTLVPSPPLGGRGWVAGGGRSGGREGAQGKRGGGGGGVIFIL